MRTIEDVNKDITEARSTSADFESVISPLLEERNVILKHDRNDYDDDNYAVLIDCPVHLTHKVKLFTHGHRYAGIWECEEEGISDTCPHYDVETEAVEDQTGHESRIYVCVLCGVAVEGDPDGSTDG